MKIDISKTFQKPLTTQSEMVIQYHLSSSTPDKIQPEISVLLNSDFFSSKPWYQVNIKTERKYPREKKIYIEKISSQNTRKTITLLKYNYKYLLIE